MKHNIKCSLYILSAIFLFALLLTMSLSLTSQPQSLAYATSQQEQEADQQEDLQTTSDTQESETNTESINSEEEGSGENENNDEDSIKPEVGCMAVATNDPNFVYCNTPQPIEPQQPTSQQPTPQQNTPSNPSQNTLSGPKIDSDTSLSNIPNTETTIPTQKNLNLADQYRPGSGLTGLTIPGKSGSLTGPYTPGAGNEEAEAVGLAYLTVYPNATDPQEICAFISQPEMVQGDPYCVQTTGLGTTHALPAPGLIGIKVSKNSYKIDTSPCEFRILPKQIKSCMLEPIENPILKQKSETTERDTTLSFNR